jgi:3-isopropylmalate dehydrogenase
LKIAVIPGDGIGPEVIAAAIPIITAAASMSGATLDFEFLPWSADHFLATGETLPESGFIHLRDEVDAILLGALGDPRVPDHRHARDIVLGLRQRLDLFINLRPVVSRRIVGSSDRRMVPGIDLVILRENTEGSYLGRDRLECEGTPEERWISEEVNSVRGVTRIIEAAFEWAALHGRRRISLCDKSNAIEGQRIWPRIFAEVGTRYPALEREHRYVDALAMELVQTPERFDVIVTTNLFGDIVSDLAAGLVGGLGLVASANLHPGRPGLFEPVHGSAPDLAGTGQANPIAAILAGGLMLEDLGLEEGAVRLEQAVKQVLIGEALTPDLGGTATTSEVAAAIETRLRD